MKQKNKKTKAEVRAAGKSRRSWSWWKHLIRLPLTHDVINRAYRKDAGHCVIACLLKIFARVNGLNWIVPRRAVDAQRMYIIDVDLGMKFTWPTSTLARSILIGFDQGRIIDDNGVIHTGDGEIVLKLNPKLAEQTPWHKKKMTVVKPTVRTPRGAQVEITPSHHRVGGYTKVGKKIDQLFPQAA